MRCEETFSSLLNFEIMMPPLLDLLTSEGAIFLLICWADSSLSHAFYG